MGVRLEFDAEQFDKGPVQEERALLEKARAGNEAAAATLLLRYEDGDLQDATVKTSVLLGQGQVTRHRELRALGPPQGKAGKVSPLSFFMGIDAKAKIGPKPDADSRLAALAAQKAWLTKADAEIALASKPVRIHRVEATLVKYVQAIYKGASDDAARRYVHGSFPNNPWNVGDTPVEYT